VLAAAVAVVLFIHLAAAEVLVKLFTILILFFLQEQQL
jgi:hypothetical protein